MDDYSIEYLADYPQHIDACAAWSYGRWGVQEADASLQRAQNRFTQGAQKNALPLTLIAVNKMTQLPIGMGSIWEEDGTEWPNHRPCIAAIFTHYRHRDKKIASTILIRLEQEAQKLGIKTLYLHTGSAAPLYEKNHYKLLDTIKTDTTQAGARHLYAKDIK